MDMQKSQHSARAKRVPGWCCCLSMIKKLSSHRFQKMLKSRFDFGIN